MQLPSSPQSSLVKKNSLLGSRLAYFRNLIMAGLLTASQMVWAQNPDQLSQSTKLPSNRHATLQSSLDGTLIESGHSSHGSTTSDSLQWHVVFSWETLTGAILPNGEFASRKGVTSLEIDAFLQKGDLSAHMGIHDISPLTSDDDFEKELAASFTVKYDHKPFHIAAGIRHYDHTALHAHQHVHIHDDGHGHISKEIQTTKELVRERYMAALLQLGYDFGEHLTVFAGTEWDLWVEQDVGQDEAHLTYAGFDIHGHISDWHLASRIMLAHSHGNKNEPNATFLRPSFHAEAPLFRKIFHDKVFFTLFWEGLVPLDNNRELWVVWGAGIRVRF